MAISLKGSNTLGLYSMMTANFAVFYGVVQNNAILTGDWADLIRHLDSMLPAGIGLALTGIFNALLTPTAKSRIVFMRWHNPLPGSEAFTIHAKDDPRIDFSSLEQTYGPFPSEPHKQNALWYQLYRSVASDPAVMQVHRAFLFTRDYTFLSLMIGIILGVAGYFQIQSASTALAYFMILGVQFGLAQQAARNHGRRLVTTVLAVRGAQPIGGN